MIIKLSDLDANPYLCEGRDEIYVKGAVDVSDRALVRLAQIGVVPPRCKWKRGYYDSFSVPVEHAHEFQFVPGSPHDPAEIYLYP